VQVRRPSKAEGIRRESVTSGGYDKSAYLWTIATRKRAALYADPGGKGSGDVAFSPDGKTLAVGDANGNIYLWDTSWLV
jgi:WD40 repeat protein